MKATPKVCAVPDCSRVRMARGWCGTHYARWQRNGTTDKASSLRDYPAEVVEKVRNLYESGMSIAEVVEAIGPGYKVVNIMRRHNITPRGRGTRDQWGEKHHAWLGDAASYSALHLRVERRRGKPSECEWCGESRPEIRYEWANASGKYEDVEDYVRLCVTCHRNYDLSRRRATGKNTLVGTKYWPA